MPVEVTASKKTDAEIRGDAEEGVVRLPKRDYVILPMISLLTVVLMVGGAEAVSRIGWPDYSEDSCSVGMGRHKANCSVEQKTMEGPRYVESYNECGYRSAAHCGPKPANTTRVALLGSSFTLAFGVPYEDGFPAKTEKQLSAACGRPVEMQNLSGIQLQPLQLYRRVDEALALNPDLLVVSINPMDAHEDYSDEDLRNRDNPEAAERKVLRMSRFQSLKKKALDQFTFVQLLQHFRYLNREDYLQHFLQYGDEVDYLRTPLPPLWARRFEALDFLLGEIARKANERNIPVVFIAGLSRVQAGLMSETNQRAGIDPNEFELRFAEIAAKHGITNIDPDPEFRARPDAIDLFYPVNGHLTPEGNTVYSAALTRGLLTSDLPAFRGCAQTQRLSEVTKQ